MKLTTHYWGLYVGCGWALLLLLIFIVFALSGWSDLGLGNDTCLKVSATGQYDDCYCEAFSQGLVKQVANTYSDLSFIIVGLLLLVIIGRDSEKGHPANPNPMNSGTWMAVLFGLVIIFMGPASMYFHASFTRWGGFLDSTSMFFLLAFIIGYDIRQITSNKAWLWASWLIAGIILAVFMLLAVIWSAQATVFFAIMVFVTLGFELPIWFWLKIKRDFKPLLGFAGFFVSAFVIWLLSHTGGKLCLPDSIWLQGHAYWHILSAVAMGFLFWYFRTERNGRGL